MGSETRSLLEDGISLARQGKREEARSLFLDIIDLNQSDLDALLWLGAISEDAEESVSYLRRALDINPQSIRAQKGMEWAQARLVEKQSKPPVWESPVSEPELVLETADSPGLEESSTFSGDTSSAEAAHDYSPESDSRLAGSALSTATAARAEDLSADGSVVPEEELESQDDERIEEEPVDAFKGVLQEETPWTGATASQFSGFAQGGFDPESAEKEESVDWQSVIARLRSLDGPSTASGADDDLKDPDLLISSRDTDSDAGSGEGAPLWRTGDALSGAGVDVLIEQGKVALERSQIDVAVARFREAIQLNPESIEAQEQLGIALYQDGKIEEALNSFETIARLKPDHTEALANLGFLYTEKGMYGEAAESLRQALNHDSGLIEARINLADVLKRLGRLDEAIEEWQICISQRPDQTEAHAGLGDIYTEQGKIPEAVWEYRLVLDRKPNDGQVHLKLGLLLLNMGRNIDAAKEFETVIRYDDSVAEAHFGLGSARLMDGNLDEAKAELEKAVALRPDYSEAKQRLEEITRREIEESAGDSNGESQQQSGKKGFWGFLKRG